MPIPHNNTKPPDPSKKELLIPKDRKLIVVVNNLENPPQGTNTKPENQELKNWNLPEQPAGYLKYTNYDMF